MSNKPKPNPALAYTYGRQENDRLNTESYYKNRIKSLRDNEGNPFSYIGSDDKGKNKMDSNHRSLQRARGSLKRDIAYQNSWIARGARANALARMKLKKKK